MLLLTARLIVLDVAELIEVILAVRCDQAVDGGSVRPAAQPARRHRQDHQRGEPQRLVHGKKPRQAGSEVVAREDGGGVAEGIHEG